MRTRIHVRSLLDLISMRKQDARIDRWFALSYAWSDPKDCEDILVEIALPDTIDAKDVELHSLPITKNVASCLQILRLIKERRLF